MAAVDEARALLDQLMGGDRNAPLPKGAALPRKRGAANGDNSGDMLLLPGKRSKSCYDKDVCPLYCAWGVDVYELFVNTKSDIGPNPYTPDDAAREEYLNLPPPEKKRLGFEYLLFHKLGELVQQCDRTVTRNQEKLSKELSRQLIKRGGQDYVTNVDETAVEQLCHDQIMVEELTVKLTDLLQELSNLKTKEDSLKQNLVVTASTPMETEDDGDKKEATSEGDAIVKQEGEEQVKVEGEETVQPKEDPDAVVKEEEESAVVKKEEPSPPQEESNDTDDTPKQEQAKDEEDGNPHEQETTTTTTAAAPLQLGEVLLQKQRVLVDIAHALHQWGSLQESVESQWRHLNHVKSDITTDKTVCDVSGNFMSARDADERIAAHYAGKQYVGWKLVRDKFHQLLQAHGKYGPPPPTRGGDRDRGGGPMLPPGRGGGGGGGGSSYGGSDRGGGRGGGYGDRGGSDRGGGFRGRRGNDSRGGGGGGGGGGGPPPPRGGGRWERGGDRGGGGGGYDRGYGGGGGGGGYDRGGGGRRGGDSRDGRDSRGGGGYRGGSSSYGRR